MRSLIPAVAAVALLSASVGGASATAPKRVVKLGDKIAASGKAVAGTRSSYKLSLTKPKGDSLASYNLTYGDGTKAVKGKGIPSKVAHSYAKPGSYKITLVVTDIHHKSATATLKVTVTAASLPNLLLNGDAEASPGAPDDGTINPPVDWMTSGPFTTVQYGASGGFPDATNSAPIKGGSNFFAGGNPDSGVSTAEQSVDVSASAGGIDSGAAVSTLSADLGGFSSQGDNMVIDATFKDATGNALGTLTIGPVTPDQRGGVTELLAQTATAPVPAGTRSIQVVMTSARTEGTYDDGYAENVALTLS